MAMESDPRSEKVRQWALMKAQSDTMTTRMNKLRDDIMADIVLHGDKDETGSSSLRLSVPVVVGNKTYEELKREARISTTLNEERALALAKAKGIENDVVAHVPTIDMDALYAAHADGRVSEEEIDSLFDTKVSYAFKPKAT
ncbi:hypothetical protein ACIOHC_35890 [Streptomyces sp. NPDC088252]|uniref:hypothetical protein n=1 Tax=Streptomyces sp. NPDC088252 TaxID=3365845 RepID=UPI0038257FA8